MPLAPMSRRTVAWVLDFVIGCILGAAFTKVAGGENDLSALYHLVAFKSTNSRTGRELSHAFSITHFSVEALGPVAGLLGIITGIVVVWVAYRVVTTTLWGAGIGKLFLDMRIVVDRPPRPHTARRYDFPSWGQSWRRFLVPQAVGLIPLPFTGCLAFVPAFRDKRCRGLHDRAARTIVIDIRRSRLPVINPTA